MLETDAAKPYRLKIPQPQKKSLAAGNTLDGHKIERFDSF